MNIGDAASRRCSVGRYRETCVLIELAPGDGDELVHKDQLGIVLDLGRRDLPLVAPVDRVGDQRLRGPQSTRRSYRSDRAWGPRARCYG